MKLTSLLFVLISASVFAAGGGSGSPKDLLYPGINFIIMLAVIWKFAVPMMRKHFNALSEETEIILNRASKKAQESEVFLAEQEGKLAHLDDEVKEVNSKMDDHIESFKTDYEKEISDKLKKIAADGEIKIQSEKKLLLNELSTEILDKVITKTKSNIKSDNAKRDKITDSLVQEVSL